MVTRPSEISEGLSFCRQELKPRRYINDMWLLIIGLTAVCVCLGLGCLKLKRHSSSQAKVIEILRGIEAEPETIWVYDPPSWDDETDPEATTPENPTLLELATMYQIGKELKRRPICFALAAHENTRGLVGVKPRVHECVVHSGSAAQAANIFNHAAQYVVQRALNEGAE